MLNIHVIETDGDQELAFAIRRAVFCAEQGVSEALEIDGRDPECRHYLALFDGAPIGTARVRTLNNGAGKVERVAILAAQRGAGHGAALMRWIMNDVVRRGCDEIVLHAQSRAENFYAGLGFRTEGGEFDEAGIPHVRMVWRGSAQ